MAEQQTTEKRHETSTLPEGEQRAGMQHPEEWRQDLNPDALAGQNVGQPAAHLEQDVPTAYEVQELRDILRSDFNEDELRRIPVLPEGSRLQQGAVYVDLYDQNREEFKATGQWEVTADHWYVPKKETPYPIWNRLIGVENPARLNREG
ncbi:MAG: hypothetical protein ACLFVO_20355 [Chloroflexaceae bacterium]